MGKNLNLSLILILILALSSAALVKKVHVYDRESFMETYNDAETKNKDTKFIRKYFKSEETVLDRIEYRDFLKDYLEIFIDRLPDDEHVREQAEEHHYEVVDNFLKLQEQREDYTIDQAIHDISLGNLMVFLDVNHDLNDHGDDEILSDEDLEVELFLKDNGIIGNDDEDEDL